MTAHTPLYSTDTATGDLYENGELVGKLITGNSGAHYRLVEKANNHQLLRDALELLLHDPEQTKLIPDWIIKQARQALNQVKP